MKAAANVHFDGQNTQVDGDFGTFTHRWEYGSREYEAK